MRRKALFAAAGAVLALTVSCPTNAGEASVLPFSAYAAGVENPMDKQDDKEVPYDASYWIQPSDWNTPTIDPRDYEGGIMMFFDKIGLEPEYGRGKVQRIYFSVTGAEEKVSYVKFHIFYDTRLRISPNSAGLPITPGRGVSGFTTGSAIIEEGQLAFYAYSDDDTEIPHSCIFTIDFIVPENAEAGDFYPIGMVYQDDGIVADTFINKTHDEAGKLQMTYLFTKGMHNGYIKMLGEKKTAPPAEQDGCISGDVNNDGEVNAVDASEVLTYYAKTSTNTDSSFTEAQKKAADHNEDGEINAADASSILAYYASNSTTVTAGD